MSTLHVVHHTLMAFTWWFGVKHSPGGLGTFHAMINSAVHTVMYFYYAVAALGPRYRHLIWWKKYLTTFQMVTAPASLNDLSLLMFRHSLSSSFFTCLILRSGIPRVSTRPHSKSSLHVTAFSFTIFSPVFGARHTRQKWW